VSQEWQQPAGQQPTGGWQQQQPAGAWQPQAHQPGGLHLRTGFFPLAFLLYLFSPRCSIDGSADISIRWGDNRLPLPPGRHHVRVWFPYMFMRQCGPAETVVDVGEPGLALEYKAPTWWMFSPGKLSIPGYGPAPSAAGGAMPHVYHQHQPQAGPAAAPAAPGPTPAGWHADPTGRFEHRYWDGQGWTPHVARDGTQTSDPI